MSEEKQGGAGLFKKMSNIMGKLERIPKNGFNKHFQYAFVEDSDVLDAVRKAMSEAGLCLFVSMVELKQEGKKTVGHFRFTFADGETGETMTVPWSGEAIDTQDKGIAKTATSAVKYFLLKTFLISTGDEPDSDSDGPVPVPARAPAQKPPELESAGATGETPPESPGTPTDKQASPWHTRADLIGQARREIPYYSHPAHIIATLKILETEKQVITWESNDEACLKLLRSYAKARADEKAAEA